MRLVICILSSLILLQACDSRRPSLKEADQLHGNHVRKATRFSLERIDEKLTVLKLYNPWQGAGNVTMKYYLLNKESKVPAGIEESSVIRVPIESIVCMSVTHAAMISELSRESSIRGLSGTNLVYSEALRRKVDDGKISEVGYEASLNNEMIAGMKPDLVMLYGIGAETGGYVSKLREMGIKIVFNADYLENDPLGRAEWIKLFGALYCLENNADSIFNEEEREYEAIRQIVATGNGNKPDVMLGLPFRDTWYISPGNSYISTIIRDAGGNYLWSDVESEISMPFGIEKVYMKSMKATFWLNTGTATSKAEITAIDSRLADLPSFQNNNLYNNNKRMSNTGGNDYWESGTVHPHLILRDIASILHPELFGTGELYFYRQISE